SPGPGKPEDSRISLEAIKMLGKDTPILGVCLGHQAIAIAFGGRVIKADKLMHGKTSHVHHNNSSVFKGITKAFTAMRYHSLIVDKTNLPAALTITAESDDGVIMGLVHDHYPVTGIQFHPESVLTSKGKQIIKNWLDE